jgi:hypothetical protein
MCPEGLDVIGEAGDGKRYGGNVFDGIEGGKIRGKGKWRRWKKKKKET